MAGLSTTGSISLGCALVAGRNRVPEPGRRDDRLGDRAHRLHPDLRPSTRLSPSPVVVRSMASPETDVADPHWVLLPVGPPPELTGAGSRERPVALALAHRECQRSPGEPRCPSTSTAAATCGHQFEIQQSFTDDALTECPECEGELRKVFAAVGITFKGSGFYKTDSRAGSSSSGSSSSPSTTLGYVRIGSDSSSSSSDSGTSSSTVPAVRTPRPRPRRPPAHPARRPPRTDARARHRPQAQACWIRPAGSSR